MTIKSQEVAERPVEVEPGSLRPSIRQRWDPLVVGVLAFVVSAIGSHRPWLWVDEAFTISAAANRSLPELWEYLLNRDGVHGMYFLFMHFWYRVFPVSEFTSRLPSLIAVGLAAAGVVVLGRQISNRAVSVTSGVVFAVLPRVTYVGIEARPYALTAAIAVWLAVLCVHIARKQPDRRDWAIYSVSLLLAVTFNMFLVLMVPVMAVIFFTFASQKGTVRQWALTTGTVCAVLVPIFVALGGQQASHNWVTPLGKSTVVELFHYQYFCPEAYYSSRHLAWLAGVILLATLLLSLLAGYRKPGALVSISLTWILVPTVAMLVYSALLTPIYNPRYLAFTTPAFALLLGYCIVRIGQTRLGITAMLLSFALVASPTYWAQRQPTAKSGPDYAQVAQILDLNANAGDCFVIDEAKDPKRWWSLRWLTVLRPETFARLTDPALKRLATEINDGYAWAVPVDEVEGKLNDCSVLWVLSSKDSTLPAYESGSALPPGPQFENTSTYAVTKRAGFQTVERWQLTTTQIIKSTLSSTANN